MNGTRTVAPRYSILPTPRQPPNRIGPSRSTTMSILMPKLRSRKARDRILWWLFNMDKSREDIAGLKHLRDLCRSDALGVGVQGKQRLSLIKVSKSMWRMSVNLIGQGQSWRARAWIIHRSPAYWSPNFDLWKLLTSPSYNFLSTSTVAEFRSKGEMRRYMRYRLDGLAPYRTYLLWGETIGQLTICDYDAIRIGGYLRYIVHLLRLMIST